MKTYKIRTSTGVREWQADDADHAREQHEDSFKGDRDERIEDIYTDGMTEPQFKPGDRCFTHYDMQWGTVTGFNTTYRNQTHGVTGSKLPDTTWYDVKYDDGSTSLLDDAHGNWDMARIVPPHIAKRYGYGDDPKKGN
jgi:hypothetical protein